MKKILLLVMVAVMLFSVGCSSEQLSDNGLLSVSGDSNSATETPVSVSDNLTFADKLNASMPSDINYMFSPFSAKMSLALAANGASGETKNEILNALGLSDIDEFNAFSKSMIERHSQADILRLDIANSIWLNKDNTSQNFSSEFENLATEFYNADVKTVKNRDAVKKINSWVNDKTNGKIPAIIQSADDFWTMLINTVYFKGAWEDEFNENSTEPDKFTSADGTESTIDFMNKTNWIHYAKTETADCRINLYLTCDI